MSGLENREDGSPGLTSTFDVRCWLFDVRRSPGDLLPLRPVNPLGPSSTLRQVNVQPVNPLQTLDAIEVRILENAKTLAFLQGARGPYPLATR